MVEGPYSFDPILHFVATWKNGKRGHYSCFGMIRGWNMKVPLKMTYPELFSFAKYDQITILNFINTECWGDHLHTPLWSSQSIIRWHDSLHFNAGRFLKMQWQELFFSFNEHLQEAPSCSNRFELLQKIGRAQAESKHKIYFWLVAHNRINTKV